MRESKFERPAIEIDDGRSVGAHEPKNHGPDDNMTSRVSNKVNDTAPTSFEAQARALLGHDVDFWRPWPPLTTLPHHVFFDRCRPTRHRDARGGLKTRHPLVFVS